jgi:tetratricopeptide (TPR) repeat protein
LAAEQADAAPDTASAITLGLEDLHRALGISPRDPVVRDEQGRLLLERAIRSGDPRDLAAARADLARLVAADAFDAQDQLRLGVAAIQAGDTAAAERAWLAADRLAPSSASAVTDLAMLYASQRRWPAAAAAARRALARDPTDAQARGVLTESAPHLGT